MNHTTATLRQREPLQLGREDMARANALFCGLEGVRESTIVATCNRIEFYMVAGRENRPFEIVSAFYRGLRGLEIGTLESCFYVYRDRHAADHLFRVAAGIDSMVLGENQVLGQIKEAYSSACGVRAAGKVMHRLFHQAFRIGKQVRSDTELGTGACSVSTATIEMIKAKIDPTSTPCILLIGLNQMITLAAQRLNRRGFRDFLFANRTTQRAVDFAREFGAEGHGLDALPDLLDRADIVITCTGAGHPIITDAVIADLLARKTNKKLLIADMAVPRDVELDNEYPGIERYDLDDVNQFVKQQQSHRADAVPDAEEIIDRKLEQFVYWFDHVRHEPLYNGLGATFEEIRRSEMAAVLDSLPDDSRNAVDHATRRLVDKLLQVKARVASSPGEPEK